MSQREEWVRIERDPSWEWSGGISRYPPFRQAVAAIGLKRWGVTDWTMTQLGAQRVIWVCVEGGA